MLSISSVPPSELNDTAPDYAWASEQRRWIESMTCTLVAPLGKKQYQVIQPLGATHTRFGDKENMHNFLDYLRQRHRSTYNACQQLGHGANWMSCARP